MSEAKLSSVLPNNSIKAAMPRMPVSTVYVENSNNKSSLEDVMCANDVTLTFQNQRFGSNSQFRFPRSYQMIGPVICNFEIAYAGDGSDATKSNGTKTDYVSHAIIEEYYWTVGGTELLRVKGEHIVPIQLDRCESEMKKRKILEYSGELQYIGAGTGYLSAATRANGGAGGKINYQCLLELPWSTIASKKFDSRKYFPVHQLSESLELSIVLRNKDKVFVEGSDASATVSLNKATLNFEYMKFGAMDQMKNQVYRFPFTYYDCRTIPFTTTAIVAGQKQLISIDLNGFRKGEVKQIQFHVVNASDNLNKTTKNLIYDGEKIQNAVLRFNGQIIWRSNGSDDLWDLVYSDQPSVHGLRRLMDTTVTQYVMHKDQLVNSAPVAGSAIAQQATDPRVIKYGYLGDNLGSKAKNGHGIKYYYTIPIAQILDKYQCQGHVLGADFTKNQIQLEFNLDNEIAVKNYNVYTTYYYQTMYQNDGSASLLIF
jgi:hypothetical protein